MRILVVDDEADAAAALGLLLTASGHEVVVAHDGATGVAAGLAGQFDVAIVDLSLGEFDGYEVAKRLRSHHGVGLTLIAYTGFSGLAVEERARANGFDRLLVKPAAVHRIIAAFPRQHQS